jgi:hypothetical protein
MARYAQNVDELKASFEGLKASLGAAFAPLVMLAIPYIQRAIVFLTKLFNTVAMIIAALTGQKTVMQAVAGEAQEAASATGTMAGNTKKAEKAAKGALAAFDEINVLQQDQPEAAAPTGGGAGGGGIDASSLLQEVEVPADYLKQVWENVKKWFKDTFIEPVKDWFRRLWDRIKLWAGNAWQWIVDKAALAKKNLQ